MYHKKEVIRNQMITLMNCIKRGGKKSDDDLYPSLCRGYL